AVRDRNNGNAADIVALFHHTIWFINFLVAANIGSTGHATGIVVDTVHARAIRAVSEGNTGAATSDQLGHIRSRPCNSATGTADHVAVLIVAVVITTCACYRMRARCNSATGCTI